MTQNSSLANRIADIAVQQEQTLGVAESLTGGQLTSELAAAPDASVWFRGGVIAYASQVKFDLLGVPEGSVVSQKAAEAMAQGAARLLGATVSIAVTGVGGPDSQDGQAPGTVWIATCVHDQTAAELYRCQATDPQTVCELTCTVALRMLLEALA